ncbi:carboxypeptidase-like regulatory domain-containing protein [Aequorivita sp. F47161]|uniref:Carboxypeptidase-like regulatory domain-containing protein n=1 Tax=Aequorivita vitellina TaxID=2874475 RepID=A0A9X1QTQ0_9FLAO|nr:carboxypeptidase-like regulatory domain-containing protein [Aequorivita vitellina]MCG2418555.1 carboxypeptidase-like regulatory domain-containing protein [Aequorivita vitellina]
MAQLPFTNNSSRTLKVLRTLFALFAILLSSSMFAQRITVEGKINTADDIEIEGVNVFNISSNKGTVSDANGAFSIAVAVNDTLSVSAIQIQTTTLIIRQEEITNKKISINLSEKMNQLSTVTLRRSLTGYIGSDANIIPIQEPITATSIGLPNADLPQLSKTRRQLYTATSGPVDALLNMISGRTKMLKKHLEFNKTAALTLSLLEKFPDSYFIDGLKIDKLKIYSFIFFCEDDPKYQTVMKQSTIEITDFLEAKSEEYRLQLSKQ